MKRKTIQSGIALLCLLGGLYFYPIQSNKNVLTDLAFENIEALAFEEGPNENIMCYGWESPVLENDTGRKIQNKYSINSLKINVTWERKLSA